MRRAVAIALLLPLLPLIAGCTAAVTPPPIPSTAAPEPTPTAPTSPTVTPPEVPRPLPEDVAMPTTRLTQLLNVTSLRGIPGYVTLLVGRDAPRGELDATAASLGGEIVRLAPPLGIGEARVPRGREAEAVAAFEALDSVLLAFPTPALVPAAPAQRVTSGPDAIVPDADLLLLDDDRTPLAGCDWTTHGGMTAAIAGAPSPPGEPTIDTRVLDVMGPGVLLPDVIGRIAMGAAAAGRDQVISISLQADHGLPEGVDRRACQTPACLNARAQQAYFLYSLHHTIHALPDEVRDRVLVVVSAGNAGIDLGLAELFVASLAPRAKDHVLLVGGLDEKGAPDPTFNSLVDPTAMLFAPGRDVAAKPGGAACSGAGTSYAAPQVARLAAQLRERFPFLNTSQIARVVRASATPMDDPHGNHPRGFARLADFEKAAAVVDILYGTGGLPPRNATRDPPTPATAPLRFREGAAPSALGPAMAGHPFRVDLCRPSTNATTTCGGNGTVDPAGGRPPYTFSTNGTSLPPGLTLSPSGRLEGTPTMPGVASFTVCAHDQAGAAACVDLTLPILQRIHGEVLQIACTKLTSPTVTGDGVRTWHVNATGNATGPPSTSVQVWAETATGSHVNSERGWGTWRQGNHQLHRVRNATDADPGSWTATWHHQLHYRASTPPGDLTVIVQGFVAVFDEGGYRSVPFEREVRCAP